MTKREPNEVQLFIDAGNDLNKKDEKGNTALMWAAAKGQPEMVKQLITKGADLNLQNNRMETALMFASKNNHKDIVRILVDAGADVNIQDRDGYTAINRYAITDDIQSILREKGAKTNAFLSAVDDANQTQFLNSLSEKDRNTLMSYIAYGLPLINGVLQDNLSTNPLGIANVTGKFMETHRQDTSGKLGTIRQFVTEFMNVVKRAPVLKEELLVYRGIKNKNDLPKGVELLSTTSMQHITNTFKGADCCLLKMNIKPGVRVIYIEPVRYEAYEIMKLRKNPPDLREILVVPPYNAEIVDEGDGNYSVTITPKAQYVRKSGTRRRKNKRRTYRK